MPTTLADLAKINKVRSKIRKDVHPTKKKVKPSGKRK